MRPRHFYLKQTPWKHFDCNGLRCFENTIKYLNLNWFNCVLQETKGLAAWLAFLEPLLCPACSGTDLSLARIRRANLLQKGITLSIEKRKISICVVVLLLTFLVCAAASAKSSASRTAPEIIVRQWMTANPPDVKNLKGRVYVVDFWATWCHSCVEGMEELNKINEKYSDRGLVFMSLCQDKSPETINRMIDEKNINFHVAIDHGTADWYEVKYYPTVAVVDHEGRIIWQGKPWDKKFVKAIDKAISAAPNQGGQSPKYTKSTK